VADFDLVSENFKAAAKENRFAEKIERDKKRTKP